MISRVTSDLNRFKFAVYKTKTTFQVIGFLAVITALFLQITIVNEHLKTIQALLTLLLALTLSFSIIRIWILVFVNKKMQILLANL
jgi:hypothetical protein